MRPSAKGFLLGFIVAAMIPVVLFCALLFWPHSLEQPVRRHPLPSGRIAQITSFHLAWGAEHDQRLPEQDSFALEYVSSGGDAAAKDQETLEVFELIRPVSELWGFNTASIAAFPRTERKGKYDLYLFSRQGSGDWKFVKQETKVFVND